MTVLPVSDDDKLAAWRTFYPDWRDPKPPKPGDYDAEYDQITLASLRRVLEVDRQRVAERAR